MGPPDPHTRERRPLEEEAGELKIPAEIDTDIIQRRSCICLTTTCQGHGGFATCSPWCRAPECQ
jgi:hypothetical protein